MSSSDTGPAVMPSGGFVDRFLYSWKRRFWATEEAMLTIVEVVSEEEREGEGWLGCARKRVDSRVGPAVAKVKFRGGRDQSGKQSQP